MRTAIAALAIAAASLGAAVPAHAQLDTRAVPTYESVGLYWTSPPVAAGTTPFSIASTRTNP